MGLELRQLRYFVAVADAGQITIAGQRLHLSQSALTLAIKALERELGLPLFDRHPGGVRLTAAGAQFLEETVKVLAAVDEAVASARRADRGEVGTLRVGVHGPPFPEVTATLNAFRAARPGACLELRELTLVTQERALARGHVDVVFNIGVPEEVPFTVVHLSSLPRVLAVGRRHRLAHDDDISIEDVLDETFVRFHPAVPAWCADLLSLGAQRGSRGRYSRDEASSALEALELVGQGHGVTTAPAAFASRLDSSEVVFRPVAGLSPVSLDILVSPQNRNPLVPILFGMAKATCAQSG